MARNPRASQGTVPVINKFGNTTGDKANTVGIVDEVMYDLGAVSFRSIQAGTGISVSVVDADDNRFSTTDKKIVIENTGSGAGEVNSAQNLGSGQGVFAGKTGADLNFKSLVAGSGVTLSATGSEITINSTGGGAATLDDLLDVDLTTTPPVNGDALVFDGTSWVPQAGGSGGGESNTASNLGVGNGLFSSKVGVDLQFKSLIAGSNISINDNGSDLTINADNVGEVNTASNLGGDQTLFAGKVGDDLQFRGITAGANVALSGTTNAVTISVPTIGEVNTGQNVGPGVGTFYQKSGTNLQFKTLVAGADITLTNNVDHIVISSTSPGEVNTMSNLGAGEGVFAQKTGVDFELKSLVAGPNISLTSDANTITIDAAAAGEANTASNIGTGSGVFFQKTGTDLEFKSILAGTNVTVSEVGDDIVISTVADVTGASNIGGGVPVFAAEASGVLQFRSLVAGSNVNLAFTGNEITIDATGEANSGANLGLGEGVFAGKVSTQLQYKSLVAGAGVTLSSDANEITIDAPGVGEANDGQNVGVGEGLFLAKSGVDLQFKTLVAGSNIALIPGANTITIDAAAAGEANTASNVGTGAQPFKQKNGTDLEFRTVIGGTNVSVTQTPDTIVIDSPDTTATASNVGTGAESFKQKTGNDLEFRTLLSSTAGLTITQNADDITFTKLPTTGANLGGGEAVYASQLDDELRFKTLVGGAGITLSSDANEITIDSAVDGANVGATASNFGEVFRDKVGDILNFKKIVGGSNVTITNGTDEIIIDAVGSGGSGGETNTGANVGIGGVGVFDTKNGVILEFKNLNTSSSALTIVDNIAQREVDIDLVPGNILTSTLDNDAGFISGVSNLNDIGDVNVGTPGSAEDGYVLIWDDTSGTFVLEDFDNLSFFFSFVKDGDNLGGGAEVFAQKSGFDLQFRTITSSDSSVSINQSATEIDLSLGATAGEVNTASNVGTGEEVFKQKDGVDFEFRTLVPAASATPGQIIINQLTDTIEIDVTGVGTVEDGLNIGAGEGVFEGKDGSNNLRFKSFRSLNDNLLITSDADEIIFEAIGEDNTASNVGGGTGIFKQKDDEDLEFKTLTTSNGMQITTPNANEIDLVAGQINSVLALGIVNPLTDFSLLADNTATTGTVVDGIADDPTYGPELKELNLRSLRAGAGVTIGLADNTLVISALDSTAGGSDTQIQYNNGGDFAGDPNFTTDGNGSVDVDGDIDVDNINIDGNTISSTDTDGDIIIQPDGDGDIIVGDITYTKKQSVAIDNNITGGAVFDYNKSLYDVAFVEYVLKRGTDGARGGSLTIVYDSVSDGVALADAGADVLDPGVVFDATVVGSNIEITYTSTNTGQTGTMSYTIRRWAA